MRRATHNTDMRQRVRAHLCVCPAAESTLSQMVDLVGKAQAAKAPVQRVADAVAGVFVPTILVMAAITTTVWYLVLSASPALVARLAAGGAGTPTSIALMFGVTV